MNAGAVTVIQAQSARHHHHGDGSHAAVAAASLQTVAVRNVVRFKRF